MYQYNMLQVSTICVRLFQLVFIRLNIEGSLKTAKQTFTEKEQKEASFQRSIK